MMLFEQYILLADSLQIKLPVVISMFPASSWISQDLPCVKYIFRFTIAFWSPWLNFECFVSVQA